MPRKNTDITIAESEIDRIGPLKAYLGQRFSDVEKTMEKLRSSYARTPARDDAVDTQITRLIRSALRKRYPKRPEGDDNRKPGVGFVLVAGSGSGKTEALEQLLVEHPAFPGYGAVGCTFVSVLCPSPSTLAALGNETLIALGYPPDNPLAEAVAWNRVRKILKKTRVMFLHYDDVHNVLQQKDANPKELKKIQATFRNLLISRSWPVQLILSGTEETLDMFKKDRQLKRRLKYVTFENLTVVQDAGWIGNAIEQFSKQAGLKYVERPGAMLVERLIHAAAYQFGLVFELLLEAIETALLAERRTFGIDDFIEAYEDRTSQPDELNIFDSPAWQTIDPSIIFEKENEEKGTKSKKKRGKKSEVSFDG